MSGIAGPLRLGIWLRDLYTRCVGLHSNQLGNLILLPEEERARLAFALLDSIEGLDPHAGMSPEEFRQEMHRRADEAYQSPGDSLDWSEAEALIRRSVQAK